MNKEEIKKIGEYLNLKYVIARDVNSNDKLETQDRYIQQLYDAYLDLRIKYNDLQVQLEIANKKFEMIKNKIRDMQKRFNQDNYKGVSYDDDLEFDDILSIIGGE